MKFKKYSKIYRVGHDETKELLNDNNIIHVEEKVDGGNVRFYIYNNKLIIGSRTQQLTDDDGEDSNMNKQFVRCVNYVRDKLKSIDLKKYNGLILYGENMIRHTINYDWDKTPPFLGFDIYDIINERYYNKKEKDVIFQELDLLQVKYLGVLNIDKTKDLNEQLEELVPISEYALESAKSKKAEGIVLKDYDRQLMAKYVRNEFKEKNSEIFGSKSKRNKQGYILNNGSLLEMNDEDLIFKYCTNQRIEKMIFKLLDEGFKLEMQMMKDLPKRIWNDVIEEEWKEILSSNWILDLKNIRKIIPKRCSAVLKQIITNNALNEVK